MIPGEGICHALVGAMALFGAAGGWLDWVLGIVVRRLLRPPRPTPLLL